MCIFPTLWWCTRKQVGYKVYVLYYVRYLFHCFIAEISKIFIFSSGVLNSGWNVTDPQWMPPTPPTNTSRLSNITDSKVGDILWIVSHCSTLAKRTGYVKILSAALKGRLSIHKFGSCNHRPFGANDKWNKFHPERMAKYRFYLSFESDLCRNYITEKFFNVLRTKAMIPIVRGAPKE